MHELAFETVPLVTVRTVPRTLFVLPTKVASTNFQMIVSVD